MPIHVTTSTTQSLSNKTFVDRVSTTGVVYADSGNSNQWSSIYSSFNTVSGRYDSTYTAVSSNSAYWDSTYSTVYTTSGSWDYQGADIKALTANWQSTYTTVSTYSAGWGLGGGSDNQTLSFDENNARLYISEGNYVSLSALSSVGGGGGIGTETDPIFTTWAQANSGNYDLAYHTILTGGDIGGNLNLTGYLSADSIRFNLGAGITAPAQGEIAWDAEDETLHYTLDTDTTARIGQDQYMRIKVEQTVKKGQALYASGASGGGSGNIQASLYNAVSGGVDELYFIGLAAADMAANDFGFAITFGKLKGVSLTNTRETDDSSSWPAGTVLYVSAKQAGFLTSIAPTAPNRDIPVAFVISESGGTRGIFVRYEHGYHLDELHDVKYIQPILQGDLLTWNNSLSVWENRPNTEPIFTTWSQANSANYQSTYTTVSGNSAYWDSTYNTVYATSGSWKQTLSFDENNARLSISDSNFVSLSALSSVGGGGGIGTETDPIFTTWAQANSAKYESTYTTVSTITGNLILGQLGISIDGGGSVITTGIKQYLRVPYNCTITSYELVADRPGSLIIDVDKSTYETFSLSASIAGSSLPTLSNQSRSRNTDLAGWSTTTLTAGEYLFFDVTSAVTIQKVTLTLATRR